MQDIFSISSHKKIYITENTFNRVISPYIKEIGELESGYLYGMQLSLLRIAKEKNNSNEVAVVYRLGSHEEVYVLGDKHSVSLEADTNAYSMLNRRDNTNLVLIHNHPSPTSFSLEDYVEFILFAKICVMCVVTNGGDTHYMIKTDKYDIRKAKALYLKLIDGYPDLLTRREAVQLSLKLLRNLYTVGIVYI